MSTIPTVDSDFNGRTILVTGASGGIGGATVRQLVRAGADVIAAGRTEDGLDAAGRGDRAAARWRSTSPRRTSVRGALEGLDVYGVVNCGGDGGEIATPMDTDIAVFDRVISVNARGALLVTKYAVGVDDPARRGRVDRQRVEPGVARGAARAHLLRLLEGRAGQHHPRSPRSSSGGTGSASTA